MINVNFIKSGSNLVGFEANGHSMSAPFGEDIVCAAVSSACLMAANTITEIIGLNASANTNDGYLKFVITDDATNAQDTLLGLKLHITELEKQYPNNIKVNNLEV